MGGLHLTKTEDAAEAFLLKLYDDRGRLNYISGSFMRLAVRIVRMRPDKAPESCTMDQIAA